MIEHTYIKKLSLILILLTLLSGILTIIDATLPIKEGNIKAVDTVTITAEVRGCLLDIKAHMERRYQDNMSTILTIEMYNKDDTTYLGSITTTTDSDGEAIVDGCAEGLTQPGGEYDYRVRGYSHLLKKFEDQDTYVNTVTDMDFTETETFQFFAGETSNTFDNKINSLDISTQIEHIFTTDYKNDLTQDGQVNSLDISNTVDNFYLLGDD